MKKKFIFLFFSILIFNCAHTLSENELNTYLKNFVCIPQNVSEITGTYQKSSGFDGEILELKKDGTCFYNNWSEISLIDNPVAGYSGKFYNSNDINLLYFSGHKVKHFLYYKPKEVST